MTTTTSGRSGSLQRFGPDQAKMLYETGMMSMPEMNPPAPEELTEWAQSGGHVVKVLFGDPEKGGMSLVWSWFGPHYALPRHSHSADCMYYITKGEIHMGRQVLCEGEGFFVPANAPYAYTAGPDGVEILEFRAVSTFDMQISESLTRWAKIVEGVQVNRDLWQAGSPTS
jgi:quercetin dioxygenase-like cupin family protein